jgi:Immunoglobulin domain
LNSINDEFDFAHADSSQRPSVRVQPQYLTADDGDVVELHCFATGQPRPRVEWTRADGRPLPDDSVIDDNVLRFPSVASAHQGEYICSAFNLLGADRASARLEIRTGLQDSGWLFIADVYERLLITSSTCSLRFAQVNINR